MDPNIPFFRNYLLHIMMVAYLVFWFVMAVFPYDRAMWAVENLLPVGAYLTLVFTYKKFRFSNLSYLLIFIFLCLHTYAAHFTYQNTPLDMWLKSSFHTKRSYFDRIVHFVFGLFLTYPIREFFIRVASLRGFWAYFIPVAVCFSFSSLFEIVEMLGSAFGGRVGADYMGMQGDIFDSQKDMGMGLTGAIIGMGILALKNIGAPKKI